MVNCYMWYLANYYEKKKIDSFVKQDDFEFLPEFTNLNPEMEFRVNEKRKINPLHMPKQIEKMDTI